MLREKAFLVIQNYFDSWLEQDLDLFLAQLHDQVLVKECTGDVYKSKTICKRWFEGWNGNGNKVLKWDIHNKYFDENAYTATVDWVFVCLFQGEQYTFEGASIIEFKDDLIYKLSEYQMDVEKKYPYE